jgi:hypothetical protein
VRHNGALTIQIIKDTTPNSAVELNDPYGRPEYGWRVKSANYAAYVLAEYTVFWHNTEIGKCYGEAGWTKIPPPETSTAGFTAHAPGSTDPKIGDLGGSSGGTVTSVTRTVVGNVVTIIINYSTGGHAEITRTETTDVNGNKTITTVTKDADCVAAGAGCTGVVDVVTESNSDTNMVNGGDERGTRARTGRISWHELIRD